MGKDEKPYLDKFKDLKKVKFDTIKPIQPLYIAPDLYELMNIKNENITLDKSQYQEFTPLKHV